MARPVEDLLPPNHAPQDRPLLIEREINRSIPAIASLHDLAGVSTIAVFPWTEWHNDGNRIVNREVDLVNNYFQIHAYQLQDAALFNELIGRIERCVGVYERRVDVPPLIRHAA